MYPPIAEPSGMIIRQADIPVLMTNFRITGVPVIQRCERLTQGGGFGDHQRHPYTWRVLIPVDGQWALVESARGHTREWTSLDRLERWLRDQGFRSFWLQNDLDPINEVGADHYTNLSGLK